MPTQKELLEQIEQLKSALATAQQASVRKAGELAVKRSEKGAVSVYGLGRFPVTLYAEQWNRLFSESGKITAFIDANKATLSHKADRQTAPASTAPTQAPEAPAQS